MKMLRWFVLLTAVPAVILGQALDPAALLKQPADAWPTYNGDYSGRRFSPLTQINAENVHTLSLAWAARYTAGGGRGGGGGAPVQIKSTPLMVNGVVYTTAGTRRAVVALDAVERCLREQLADEAGASPPGGFKLFSM